MAWNIFGLFNNRNTYPGLQLSCLAIWYHYCITTNVLNHAFKFTDFMLPNMPNQAMILLAEAEEATRESLEMVLIDEGYDCYAVSCTKSLLRALHIHQCDLIIVDIDIIYADIGEITSVLRKYPNPPSILVTLTYGRIADMLELIKFGIGEYLLKPFQFEEMVQRIPKLITHKTYKDQK